METFLQMVHRLREVHANWSHKMCIIAARYYLGVESYDELTQHCQPRPSSSTYELPPLLEYGQVREIISMR